MSLETIVQNMVTAKEPEANIAKVIKHYNQINSSPLNQIEEVETVVAEETPECNGVGMVWSESAQKCVPEENQQKYNDFDKGIFKTDEREEYDEFIKNREGTQNQENKEVEEAEPSVINEFSVEEETPEGSSLEQLSFDYSPEQDKRLKGTLSDKDYREYKSKAWRQEDKEELINVFENLGSSVPKHLRPAYEYWKATGKEIKRPFGGVKHEGGKLDLSLIPEDQRLVHDLDGDNNILEGFDKTINVWERKSPEMQAQWASGANMFWNSLDSLLEAPKEDLNPVEKNAIEKYADFAGKGINMVKNPLPVSLAKKLSSGILKQFIDKDFINKKKKINYKEILEANRKIQELGIGDGILGSLDKKTATGFASGDDLVAGVASSIMGVASSVIPAAVAGMSTTAATGSPYAGAAASASVMFGLITPAMITDYNIEKANRLYPDLATEEERVNKLIDDGLEETAIPLSLGILGTGLEYAGFKGISQVIAKDLAKRGSKNLAKSMWAISKRDGRGNVNEAALRETGTEIAQLVPELTNEASAKGLDYEEGLEYVWDNFKEQAPEVAVQSFVGSRLFIGGGRGLMNASKVIRDRYPTVEGVNANSFGQLGNLKHQREKGSYNTEQANTGLDLAIELESQKIKQAVKNSNDVARRLDDQQVEKINTANKTIKKAEEQIQDLKNEFELGLMDRNTYQEALSGFNGLIQNENNIIDKIIDDVSVADAKTIRKTDGTFTTQYDKALQKIEAQQEKRSNQEIAFEKWGEKNAQLKKDRDSGKISLNQFKADEAKNNREYKESKAQSTKQGKDLKESVKGVKESSVKASKKLQEVFDKGVKDGDITQDKDGKNVIGNNSMKQILDTQLPFIKKLTNTIWSGIPNDKRIQGGKQLLEDNITSGEGGLYDLLRTYNGEIPLGAYLQQNLRKRAVSKKALNGVSNQQFQKTLDDGETQSLITEEDTSIPNELKNINTAQELGIGGTLLNTIKDAAKKALLTSKEAVDNIKFKSDIAKTLKDALYSNIKKELNLKDTKKNKGLTKAIKNNPVAFYDALSVESMRMARTKDGKNPFEEAGFLVRNKDGVLEKKKYNQKLGLNFLDYFIDPNLKASTRSDRQMNLIEALTVSMGAREGMSLLENDVEFRERFIEQQQKEKEQNIFEKAANKIDPQPTTSVFQKNINKNQFEANAANKSWKAIAGDNQVSTLNRNDSNFLENFKINFLDKFANKFPESFWSVGNFAFSNRAVFKNKSLLLEQLKNIKFDKNKIAQPKRFVYTKNKKIKNFGRGANKLSLDAYVKTQEFKDNEAKKLPYLKDIFLTIQNILKEDSKALPYIIELLKDSTNSQNNWIRAMAPFTFFPPNFNGIVVEEHQVPQVLVAKQLLQWAIDGAVEKNFSFIANSYQQGALKETDDNKLSGNINGRPFSFKERMSDGWKWSDSPWARYFNSFVNTNSNGINPNEYNILKNNKWNKTIAQIFNVQSDGTLTPDIKQLQQESIAEQSSDQVENLIDRAISKLTELTGSKGTLQMNLASIPANVLIGGLRTVKLAYQGGKTLAQAIEKGYSKIKDYMSAQEWADFVSKSTQEVRNEKNPAQVKLAILSEKGVAQMQEQSRKTDEALLKEFGIEIDGLSTDQIVEKLNTLRKAKTEASNTKNPTKKARVFDFDDTLAKTNSKVGYTLPDGTSGNLDATQFAEQYNSLKEAGATFDYSEFNKVKKGSKGPLANLAKRFTEALGDRDVFVLTARPAESAQAIQEFLRSTLGISIPLKNISGLENGTPGAKALWIAEKVSEKYNDIFFADDSKANVDAVKKMLTDLGVTNKVQQAKEDGKKTLEDEMDSLVRTNKPSKIGKILNKLNIYIPPGADDFAGLLSYFVGSGKKGEQQQKWFKDNLLDPFGKGINAWTSAKVSLANDYKALKKRFKNKKLLAEKVLGGLYTKEQAVRAYLYDKAGQDLGLNKADTQDLIDLVEGNADLKAFADELSKITKLENGYPNITQNWSGGNIGTDIANVANTSLREMFMQDFINNKNQIFTDQNLKLIKQAYGNDFTDALENILERMTTGINRKKGKDKEFNTVMNWINQSVGAVMAVNMRSAILQQLSIVNYTNWSFNNPFMMAKAMANVPQFLKDYAKIWNSPFLKERRGGMAIDVNMNDIADSNPGNLFLRMNKKILELGFKPTQWGDSNAISFGGAMWYRNKVNRLIKEGMPKDAAEAQAMLELRELSEEHQQSSRPDRISRQQSSDIGRLILAFANTPLQLARSTKKAVGDLIYRRGDAKTNMSKIMYYGVAQSLIFTALQQGLFSLFADDDEEIDEKEQRKLGYAVNSVIDGLLRGVGFAGSTIAALKNLGMEYAAQYEKRQAGKYVRDGSLRLIQKGLTISPPVSKKIGDIVEAQKFETWRQYKHDPFYQGFAIANYISGLTNIPVDRVFKKIENLKAASDDKTEAWQSIFLALGWSPYNVDVQWPERPPKKKKKKTPLKALKSGVLGKANRDGTIEVAPGLSPKKRKEVIDHEKRHVKEIKSGKLDYDDGFVYYGKKKFARKNGRIAHAGKWKAEGDHSLPWEKFAHNVNNKTT